MPQIKVNINGQTGEVKISAEGYQGQVCKQKTKPFEDRLGITSDDAPTEEMYNEQENTQNEDQY